MCFPMGNSVRLVVTKKDSVLPKPVECLEWLCGVRANLKQRKLGLRVSDLVVVVRLSS